MLAQEAFHTLKFLVSTMLEKRGTGELSKHFIIKNVTFFGVQILRKVRQDNGENGGEIIEKSIAWDESKFVVTVLEEVKECQTCAQIENAKILVACGRGVKDIAPARELAVNLDGSVAASRALVDGGVMEHACQVGQTGKTVRPQAYLAFGISGAIQHLAGMEESEFIVAVNTDKNAPIFKVANLGIVADAAAVMKQLNKIL